mgnify:CR=1 FL=1
MAFSRELESDPFTLMYVTNPEMLVVPNNNPLIRVVRVQHADVHQALLKTIRVPRTALHTEKIDENWFVRIFSISSLERHC